MLRKLLLGVAAVLAPTVACAQSSLGISGLTVHLSAASADMPDEIGASLDTAITEVHGLQLDVGYIPAVRPRGMIAAHLYMLPKETEKYGLFLSFTDLDAVDASYVLAGIEGQVQPRPGTVLHGALGIGFASFSNLDTIMVNLGATQSLGPHTWIDADLTLADWDEFGFSGLTSDLSVGLSHRIGTGPVVWTIGGRMQGLTGDNAADTRVGLFTGLTVQIGRASTGPDMARAFGNPDPFTQILDRGIVTPH